MKGVLLFLLMIVAAVFLGLAIAYWYLSRFADNGGPVRKPPRAVPFPAKHPPVDLTPNSPNLPRHRVDATATPDGADIDGLMRRLAATKAEQEQPLPHGTNPDRDRDDLKRIVGIGPTLERMLNDNGIVSFWQIAEWQDADVQAMDKLLPAFHGRIRRDDWIEQARRLRDAKETGNGTTPA